jgi:hypothetical protein
MIIRTAFLCVHESVPGLLSSSAAFGRHGSYREISFHHRRHGSLGEDDRYGRKTIHSRQY